MLKGNHVWFPVRRVRPITGNRIGTIEVRCKKLNCFKPLPHFFLLGGGFFRFFGPKLKEVTVSLSENRGSENPGMREDLGANASARNGTGREGPGVSMTRIKNGSMTNHYFG